MKPIFTVAISIATILSSLSLHAKSFSKEEFQEIAEQAYIYAYPMVLMDVTRAVGTNVETPKGPRAPINQFAHMREFPDATFTDIVRPNADTLYSALFYDVSQEPVVFSIPSSSGRYFLLPVLDLWTDVFTVPGSRTTGTEAQTFAIVGPQWQGSLPKGVREYRSPTNVGMLIGRTQTNGKADYAAVRKFQDGMKVYPLSYHGRKYVPPSGTVNPKQDMSAPPSIVEKMSGETFFRRFAEVLKNNAPHANDYPILERIKLIGLVPGQSFLFDSLSTEAKQAIQKSPDIALTRIKESIGKSGTFANGWRTNTTAIGTYGTDYLHRAGIAFAGLGANVIEDAIYPSAFADSEGQPFQSDRQYTLHFKKGDLPPARAFWSLTMYDERQLFADNPINRYAIGDRDKLRYNSDGSLDLYIQRASPGKGNESNWLPTPKSGSFTMNLRLYWPKISATDGSWSPPPVIQTKTQPQLSQKE